MYMAVKRLKLLLAAFIYCLGFSLLNVGLAAADSRPYVRIYGADIATGGWFNNGSSSCNPSDTNTYQAPDYTSATNLYKGGIMTYGSYDSSSQKSKGAGSEFGASSLGLIEGASSVEPYGFSTGSSGYNSLSFANKSTLTASNYWGGFLEGSVRQTHCVPDYFGTLQNSPTTVASASDVSTLNSGQFLNTTGGITTVGASAPLASGKKITLFVSGNVYISSNITYASHNETNVPKFALVVKGSIYVAPSVTQLDGLYIAEPNLSAGSVVAADTGNFWTCHANNATIPTDNYVSANCRTKLTVNGSVIAKQINLFRVNGDIASAPPNEPSTSPNIAEVFNFTPDMVAGGGFFNSTTGSSGKIESLVSLPPVF